MSDLQPDNGGGVPPEDGALPDLPADWGSVVIPDDAAELDAEATEIRRELRREAWRTRLRVIAGLGPGRRHDAASLGVPIVIMAVAVITTLLSLFVVTWDHRRSATAPAGPDAAGPQTSVPLPDVTLADSAGSRVRLGNLLPAVVLLVDGCDCNSLINAIADAAPAPVTVVPVSVAAPCPVGTRKNVRCLADPARTLTGRYPTAAAASAATQKSLSSNPVATLSTGAPTAARSGAPGFTPPSPLALAVPVDADGAAHEPVLVDDVTDLAAVLANLTTGG
ncbi:MAG TPA: hypothetical protein VH561_12515 [Micromonosporaceae bacterium]|jgi:hypothetical protein